MHSAAVGRLPHWSTPDPHFVSHPASASPSPGRSGPGPSRGFLPVSRFSPWSQRPGRPALVHTPAAAIRRPSIYFLPASVYRVPTGPGSLGTYRRPSIWPGPSPNEPGGPWLSRKQNDFNDFRQKEIENRITRDAHLGKVQPGPSARAVPTSQPHNQTPAAPPDLGRLPHAAAPRPFSKPPETRLTCGPAVHAQMRAPREEAGVPG